MRSFLFFIVSTVLGGILFFVVPEIVKVSSGDSFAQHAIKEDGVGEVATNTERRLQEDKKEVAHIATPANVKALYMSQCVVGTKKFREELVQLVEETELNAIVIDVKDYTGKIAFSSENPLLKDSVSDACGASDMRDFIATLHKKGVYVIGRITVFQDPFYAQTHPDLAVHTKKPVGGVWKDRKGLSFVDVGARPFWEYIVALSHEAYATGFDELNYDYVRYPSDGNMENTEFSWTKGEKTETLELFFSFLHTAMKDVKMYPQGSPALSVDLFGMTTTAEDDMGIGQVWERALPYFDFLAPMVYPSHYPSGFNGWKNPNTVPYDLIYFVLESAIRRTEAISSKVRIGDAKQLIKKEAASSTGEREVPTGLYEKVSYSAQKVRPWIQDFDYGGDYGPQEVRAQIKAVEDLGLTSWMLWAPSNRYTREALRTE